MQKALLVLQRGIARLDSKVSKLAQSILEFKRRDLLGTRTSSQRPLSHYSVIYRLEILDRIHDGHQGIVKCSRRTKESVLWPGLGKQLEEMVTNCH